MQVSRVHVELRRRLVRLQFGQPGLQLHPETGEESCAERGRGFLLLIRLLPVVGDLPKHLRMSGAPRQHAMLEENRTSKEKATPRALKRGSTRGMTTLGTTTGGHNGGRMAGVQALLLAPLMYGKRGRTYQLGLRSGGNPRLKPGETAVRSSRGQAPARSTLEHGPRCTQSWTTSQTSGTRTELTSRSRWGRQHRRSALRCRQRPDRSGIREQAGRQLQRRQRVRGIIRTQRQL